MIPIPILTCEVFPNTIKQFFHTSSGVHNSPQFWHCLPGDSLRSHRLRIFNPKHCLLLPPSDTKGKSRLSPLLLTNRLCRSEVSTTHSLNLMNLLEWFTELRARFYLLDYRFMIKGYKPGTARWKGCIEQDMRKEHGVSIPSLREPFSQYLNMFINLEALWTPSFWIFMEASLLRCDRINHYPLVIELSL